LLLSGKVKIVTDPDCMMEHFIYPVKGSLIIPKTQKRFQKIFYLLFY